ncbi:phage tail tube protein [Fibrella forsythiae]|uniref:Phage tail protein n=1 Tax=Fibrella forsythiae TaxID=2817061 RepID=A0ABS3JEI8_9BACT|nr:hypothetical protein [Fibrella forsythiae]MBO0947282.1 hypothetical protein [Fibrella forsythiae]
MSTLTYGIAKIEYAPIPNDGAVPTTGWLIFGNTKEGTGKLDMADGTKTEFRVEENAQAIKIVTTPGAITASFEIADADIDSMPTLFGGQVGSAGTPVVKTWNMPANPLNPELALKITTLEGFIIVMPRGQWAPKISGDLSRTGLLGIPVVVTALAPIKTDIGPLQLIKKSAA